MPLATQYIAEALIDCQKRVPVDWQVVVGFEMYNRLTDEHGVAVLNAIHGSHLVINLDVGGPDGVRLMTALPSHLFRWSGQRHGEPIHGGHYRQLYLGPASLSRPEQALYQTLRADSTSPELSERLARTAFF